MLQQVHEKCSKILCNSGTDAVSFAIDSIKVSLYYLFTRSLVPRPCMGGAAVLKQKAKKVRTGKPWYSYRRGGDGGRGGFFVFGGRALLISSGRRFNFNDF